MHVVGIRDSLLEDHPGVAAKVVAAFEEAKARALPHLVDLDALSVTLPWLVAEAEETKTLMGDDFWPYGLEKTSPHSPRRRVGRSNKAYPIASIGRKNCSTRPFFRV